jgi:NitT/TauT family transport system substrate-binding protein
LTVAITSCLGPSETSLRIGANLWTVGETLFLATDLGDLKGKTIQLMDFPSVTEEIRAYHKHDIKGAGLSTMRDLRGKRVGVEPTALGAFFLARAREINGMTPKDVNLVSPEMIDHEAADAAGMVDAVVSFGPARIQLRIAGAKPRFDSSLIPGEIVDTLAASRDVIASNRENLQALVDAKFKPLDHFKSNPAEASRKLAKSTQGTSEERLEEFHLLKKPSLNDNVELLNQQDSSLVLSMGRLIRVMHDNGLIAKRIDLSGLLGAYFFERLVSRRKRSAI